MQRLCLHVGWTARRCRFTLLPCTAHTPHAVHGVRTSRQVPINFFVMPGRRVREHFSSYAKEAYVDEVRLRVHTVCTRTVRSARACAGLPAGLALRGARHRRYGRPSVQPRALGALDVRGGAPRQPRCPLPPRRLT